MLQLLGAPGSPFFRKRRIVLEEKRLPYEPVLQRPFPKTPELLAMHPMGKVSILKDGDLIVSDSSVICAYLERSRPGRPMYPAGAADYASRFKRVEGSEIDWTEEERARRPIREYLVAPDGGSHMVDAGSKATGHY